MIDKCSGSRQSLNRISDTVAGLVWYLLYRRKSKSYGPWGPHTHTHAVLGGGTSCLPSGSHRPGRQSLGDGSARRGASKPGSHIMTG